MGSNPPLSWRFYRILDTCLNKSHRRSFTTLIYSLNTSYRPFSSSLPEIIHRSPIRSRKDPLGTSGNFNLIKTRSYGSNVTCRLNWDTHSALIEDLIKDSDFVALDVEYTGLHIKDERFVGIEKCYESHVLGAKKFIPCQIGLTMAKFEKGFWKVTPTSLFTIPSEGKTFSVSMSTLNFLKDNNFDFNNWIRNGICHLTPKEEEERKCLIVSKLKNLEEVTNNLKNMENSENQRINDYDLTSIQDLEDRRVVENVVEKVEKWLFSKDKEPLEFEVESAFLRLLIHSVISIKFPNLYSNSCKKNNSKYVCVYKSQLELVESEKKVLEEELEAINREVGMRSLFEAISKNNKILVGHNCFYDILHIYQTFYEDLPDQVDSFKKEWIKVFPKIFDTKYISEFYQQFSPQNSLKTLYDSLVANSGPMVEIETLPETKWNIKYFNKGRQNLDENNRNKDNNNNNNHNNNNNNNHNNNNNNHNNNNNVKERREDYEHDAGYDSFMTSVVFIHQLEEIIRSKNSTLANLLNNKMANNSVEKVIGNVFGDVVNSVRLVKCQPSVINMDNEEDMSKHFYMFGFPNAWKKWEIMKIWSPLWVSISWIDETSCWIIARNSEDVKNINLIYKMMKNPQFKLYNYGQYLERVHNNGDILQT